MISAQPSILGIFGLFFHGFDSRWRQDQEKHGI